MGRVGQRHSHRRSASTDARHRVSSLEPEADIHEAQASAPAPAPHLLHLKYRPDIDGLRAVAVLSVLCFHAFPGLLPGGFIGVDLFFVISGYLITTILLGSLAGAGFSYREFYARRIRRIFPALLLVMGCSFAFGWWVLLPDEFRQLGRQTAAAGVFLSNFGFWSESGYFDTAALGKPLLHLWSLAVEEQFYIAWPLLLALAWRGGRRVMALTVAIGLASFLVNVGLVHAKPAATFYLPWSRFWELLAGALLAWLRLHRPRAFGLRNQLQSIVGLALIAFGLLTIDEGRAFPGWWAVTPVLGACLCIAAGPEAGPNRVLLGAKWLVGVGLVSYPLYLWHWPLLVYARILAGDTPSIGVRGAVAAASVLLAWATWRWVERPLRHGRQRATVAALAACMVLLAGLGALAAAGKLGGRQDDPMLADLAAAAQDWKFPDGLAPAGPNQPPLFSIGNGPRRVLLIGDSHVQQYAPRAVELARTAPDRLQHIEFGTGSLCPPIPGVLQLFGADCEAQRDALLALARSDQVDTVVLGACWSCYFIEMTRPDPAHRKVDVFYYQQDGVQHGFRDGNGVPLALQSLENTLRELAAHKKVYLLLDNPRGSAFEPRHGVAGSRLGRLSVASASPTVPDDPDQARLRAQLRQIAERAGAQVIDPAATLCHEGQCLRAMPDGAPAYMDDNHLRAAFARSAATWLDPVLSGSAP